MSVDVETHIEINRPRDQVAAYVANPNHAPAWYENIKTVDWKSAPLLVVGSRIAFTARFLGRSLSYTYEIREFVPGQRLVMSTAEGPFPMETTYTWADTPSRRHAHGAAKPRANQPASRSSVRR